MERLTPSERARYANGSWLSDDRPRCSLCGCLRINHEEIEEGVWGECGICGCPNYEERPE